MGDTEDLELVQRTLRGDRSAFEILVIRYQKTVFNIAVRMCGRYEDAQDITQSVFLKAYRNLDSFDDRHRFFSWIYRMAMNESINFVHRRKPAELIEETQVSPDPDPQQALENAETEQSILQAIATLSPEYRAVIVLRHFEDLAYDEIARALGISEKRVKSRLFSARRLLCEMLAERGVTIND